MRNKIWLAALVVAFAAGFGTHAIISAPDSSIHPQAQLPNSAQLSNSQDNILNTVDIELPDDSSQINNPEKYSASTSSKNQSSHSGTSVPSSSSSIAAIADTATDASSSATSTPPNQLSDEEIDQKIPKPFNASFKKAHPTLKEKYKDFLDTDHHHKDDWDIRTQGLLTDFVLSRPLATDITIESISCNANMCEMRLFEQKKFLLLSLFGELMQQPWLSNQVNGNVDFNPDHSACYILLMRKTQ